MNIELQKAALLAEIGGYLEPLGGDFARRWPALPYGRALTPEFTEKRMDIVEQFVVIPKEMS